MSVFSINLIGVVHILPIILLSLSTDLFQSPSIYLYIVYYQCFRIRCFRINLYFRFPTHAIILLLTLLLIDPRTILV